MLVWEEGYKVGQADMDSEHLILLAILNQLDANLRYKAAASSVSDVLQALDSYFEYHFAHEEALMRAWNYPDIGAHLASHHDFMTKFARLRADSAKDDAAVLGLRHFVLDWLLDHIVRVDTKSAAFIDGRVKSRRVKPRERQALALDGRRA